MVRTSAVIVAVGLAVAGSLSPLKALQREPQRLQTSCREFMQSFYDWYVPVAGDPDNPTTASTIAIRQRPSVFAPALLRLLMNDAEAEEHAVGESVGLDSDPFLLSQDVDPHQAYSVESVHIQGAICRGDVRRSGDRRAVTVIPQARFQNNRWQFTNFYDPDAAAADLVSILKQLAANRRRNQ